MPHITTSSLNPFSCQLPPAPTLWNYAAFHAESAHEENVTKFREKITQITNAVLGGLVVATAIAAFAAVKFSVTLLAPGALGVALVGVFIYRLVIPRIFHYSMEERGLPVAIPDEICREAWNYDLVTKKLIIPRLEKIPLEARKRLIQECVAKDVKLVFKDLQLRDLYDPKEAAGGQEFEMFYALCIETALKLIPHEAHARKEYKAINRQLEMLTLINFDGRSIVPFLLLADPQTLIIHYPRARIADLKDFATHFTKVWVFSAQFADVSRITEAEALQIPFIKPYQTLRKDNPEPWVPSSSYK